MDGFSEEDMQRIYQMALEERQNTATGLLNQGKTVMALKEALRKPPLGSKDEQLKRDSFELVSDVVLGIKKADITNHIQELDDEHIDGLMRYVYYGLSTAENSNLWLDWHAKVVAYSGKGVIIRVMSERRSILERGGDN
eukprot:TRINITY_DN1036_c1_g1_i4.p1 TRINITY_DN1036_c1_g1~~TRINITY_DN1036_c1_g1_i4.p1  ORF type:complete len:139 (-),score=65.43 TRINITY_DN1036_c1_g1_i4:288-704(-)